ncbi:MAG: acyl-[Lachnospiraceae bacterium]|nr:acyl-[acyl-carrier-protein] thioesterase [Lachnospiraceae bacterium]
MYEIAGRIRYSEVDDGGKLTLGALLDYFQDCSTFHGEDVGMGVAYMAGRQQAWVLSAWQIVVERYPELGEKVQIKTAPYDFKGFFGYRNFLMVSDEGERLACANTLWMLLDTQKVCPVRIPEEIVAAYVVEKPLPMDYAPRRIEIPPKEGRQLGSIEIKRHHLDMNHHVNNGQYIKIAMEYLQGRSEIRQMRAEYKKQAVLGNRIEVMQYEVTGGDVLVLQDRDGQAYCIVELIKMKTSTSNN